MEAFDYYSSKLDITQDRLKVAEWQDKNHVYEDTKNKTLQDIQQEQDHIDEMARQGDELLKRITMTGYDQMKEQLAS